MGGKKRIRLDKSKSQGRSGKTPDGEKGRKHKKDGLEPRRKKQVVHRNPTKVDARLTPKSFQEKCAFIAELSEAILQDPRQAFLASKNDPLTVVAIHENNSRNSDNLGNDEDDITGEMGQEEQHVKRVNRMKRLIDMANQGGKYDEAHYNSMEERQHVARLAMVSLLAIFSDILPTYRIRPPTSEELSVRVSKETKQLWDYEAALLLHYQQYLNCLEQTWNKLGKSSFPPPALAATAIMCLCELLKSSAGMNFNFRSRVLQIVVRSMNYQSGRWLQQLRKESDFDAFDTDFDLNEEDDDPELVVLNNMGEDRDSSLVKNNAHEINCQCCEAVEYIFRHDKQGDIALEAVRLITKSIKERHCNGIHPRVLKTFQVLPLRVHEDEATAAKLHDQAAKKKRKKNKAEADIEDELKEKNATVDKSLLAKSQAETLELVTLTYFRVIQKASDEFVAENNKNGSLELGAMKTTSSKASTATRFLLPITLEGLAKVAHLINIDTVVDLLDVLKQILRNIEQLPVDAALNCILTAFQILQGPGRELQIDPKEYITPLYFQLPRLISLHDATHANTALKCLDSAFIQRREFSQTRVAAFVKQLLTLALHTSSMRPECAAPLLAFVRAIASRYSSVHRLFENELDSMTNGTYNPLVTDPEHSNPFSANAWELSLLKFSPDASLIGKQAMDCADLKMPNLPKEDPALMFNELAAQQREGEIHHRIHIKRHPLAPRSSASDAAASRDEGGSKKRRRDMQQIRFITPYSKGSSKYVSGISFDEEPILPMAQFSEHESRP